ncbi:MAG: phosphoadenylyl-sulfate reductase [Candidatus Margulisiibacteriota bacterium]
MTDFDSLNHDFEAQSPQAVLEWAIGQFGNGLLLASSLGVEDQVLTDMLVKLNPKARIFVLDTGRLHQETYEVMGLTQAKYSIRHEVYFPDAAAVEALVRQKGPNSFFESVENRKECCHIRKVEPLKRALSGAKAWITGLRREQAVTRTTLPKVEWDEAHGLIKLNPLADWTTEQVWDYVKTHDVPVNYLHKQGYPSIGCAPCTRAIKPGEDLRAGRWWWENPDGKECGLHVQDRAQTGGAT